MIENMFIKIIEASIPISLCILIMVLLTPLFEKKYFAKVRYVLWLIILFRLLIPIDLNIGKVPIQIDPQPYVIELSDISNTVLKTGNIPTTNSISEYKADVTNSMSMMEIASWLWFAIALSMFTLSLYKYIRFIFEVRKQGNLCSRITEDMLLEVKKELGIHSDIDIKISNIVDGPMILGIINPTILLPVKEYSRLDLYMILKHECIHYKRHDLVVKFFMCIVKYMYWFNPFVHIMMRYMNQTIEMTCDELVIGNKDANYKKHYVNTILAGMDYKNRKMSMLMTSYNNGGINNIKKRFANIASNGSKKRGQWAMVIAIIGICSMMLFVGCKVSKSNDSSSKDDTPSSESNAQEQDIVGVESEGPNQELASAISKYMDFDEEANKATRYYYNYVDLNDDGKDEAIVLLVGMYTSGSGGSTALIMEKDDEWTVKQELTLINPPIIVSDHMTDGWKNLIVYKSGGGATASYVILKHINEEYTTVNDGVVIDNLDGITGVAIINDDLAKDIQEGKGNYLE